MRRPRASVAALAATLLLTGCGGNGTPTAEQPPTGTWVLVEGDGPDGEVPLVDDAPITLEVENGEAGGTAACNSYGGSVEVDGSQLRFHELFQTEMACEGEGIMASEAAYLEALRTVESHHRDDERLELTGEDVRLVFEPRGNGDGGDDTDGDTQDAVDPDEPVTDEPSQEPDGDSTY